MTKILNNISVLLTGLQHCLPVQFHSSIKQTEGKKVNRRKDDFGATTQITKLNITVSSFVFSTTKQPQREFEQGIIYRNGGSSGGENDCERVKARPYLNSLESLLRNRRRGSSGHQFCLFLPRLWCSPDLLCPNVSTPPFCLF